MCGSIFVRNHSWETRLTEQVSSIYIAYIQLLTSTVGTLHFPHAETLPFPYPFTTTLFQFTLTHVCLSLGWLFARSVNSSLDKLGGRSGRLQSPSNVQNSIYPLNWPAILRLLPPAITVAAEAASGNHVLFNMPFEVYLLSRALVLPFLLILDRFIYKRVSTVRLIYPSIALSVTVLITALKPPLPHSGRTLLVAIFTSVLCAIWPLQVEIRIKNGEPLTKGEYSMVRSEETTSKHSVMEISSIWTLLCSTSLVSTILLVPIVLYSGEPGHILRNCYFLEEFGFWKNMVAGAIFRLAFFTSTILLIQKTSALTATFFCVLVSVTQITVYSFNDLGRLQLLGLTGSSLSTLWFLIASFEFDQTWATIWQDDHPSFRQRFYSVVFLIAIIIGFGTVAQIFHQEIIVDGAPPLDMDDDVEFPMTALPPIVQGIDSFLGHRPPTNSIVNLQLLMEECGGLSNSVPKDVFRCLEFLSTKQDKYIIPPSEAPEAQPRGDNFEALDNVASIDAPFASTDMCDGPFIPYHIWGGNSPTWRIELFIKAYLHTQNLLCSRLWIWVDGKHEDYVLSKWVLDQRFRRFMPLIENGDVILREWTLPAQVPLPPRNTSNEFDQARYYKYPGGANSRGERLVADSVLQDASGQEWLVFYEDENQITYYDKAVSDVARFTIVHMYGGIYLDSGAILLRDIRPLLLSNTAFIEKPDPREPFGNSIIALPANSSISSYMLRGGTRMGLFFHAAILHRMFVREGRDGNRYDDGGLVRLEDAIFDPIWAESHGLREGRCTIPCLSSYVSVFKSAAERNEWESFDGNSLGGNSYNRTLENFYRGAFAYHIHGQVRELFP